MGRTPPSVEIPDPGRNLGLAGVSFDRTVAVDGDKRRFVGDGCKGFICNATTRWNSR
jgi:hypothetical protein